MLRLRKTLSTLCYSAALIGMLSYCAKKSDPSPSSSSTPTQAVVITSGAKTIEPGQTINLTANIVDASGNVVPATNVTWSSSDPNIAKVVGNVLTAVGNGTVVVTASYVSNGATVTSKVVYSVTANTSIFTVAPQAIIWSTDAGTIDLIPVYFGSGTPNYTYTSSDASVVTVSANGKVSFIGNGSATITVKADGLDGKPTYTIPVLVVGPPAAPLPVTKVVINPGSQDIFKGQTFQFTAKAYNSSNAEVSGETFTWTIENDTNNLRPNAVSINSTGLVTAKYQGNATVYATAKGIRAQASIQVLPDSVILVTPYYVSLQPSTTTQFSAALYKVNRTTKQIEANPLTMPSNLKWEIPSYASIDPNLSILDIATTDQTGKVSVKSTATTGMVTVLSAYLPGTDVGGAALIQIATPSIPTSTGTSIPGL